MLILLTHFCFGSVRAHIAIILILTLTIDAFVPEDSALGQLKVAGDYSAVFPLLTVAVFVALQISRQMVFYEKQRSRGDIQALPEALCEPGKEGKPWVMDYEGKMHALDEGDYDYETESDNDASDLLGDHALSRNGLSREDIEANFQSVKAGKDNTATRRVSPEDPMLESLSDLNLSTHSRGHDQQAATNAPSRNFKSLDELLNGPVESELDAYAPVSTPQNQQNQRSRRSHRRTQSEPFQMDSTEQRMEVMWSGMPSNPVLRRPSLKRVDSYGEIDPSQPSLMDQVRVRAASVDKRASR